MSKLKINKISFFCINISALNDIVKQWLVFILIEWLSNSWLISVISQFKKWIINYLNYSFVCFYGTFITFLWLIDKKNVKKKILTISKFVRAAILSKNDNKRAIFHDFCNWKTNSCVKMAIFSVVCSKAAQLL